MTMNTRLLVPILVALSALPVHAINWPQYRGPTTDGRTTEQIGHVWSSSGPRQIWKVPSEGGFSSFAVAGGRAFTLALKEADGAKQESLVALDANTGKELWFAPLNFAKYDGGGPGESLLAINPKDGSVAWKGFDEKMTHATPVAANILGQPQIIFFVQSGLLSVEPKTGKELWRYPFQYLTSTAASPVVAGNVVYCSAGYGIGAGAAKITKEGSQFVATEIYRLRGNKPVANHWSTPVVKDGHLYGMFQFKEFGSGPIKCVDIATGEVKWEKDGFGPGQVILAGDRLLALSDTGELILIDPRPDGYKELARADVLDGKCWSTPVLADGRIYARSTKEAVCLDVK